MNNTIDLRDSRKIRLRVEGGTYAIVWEFKDGLKLCASDRQGKRVELVQILERTVKRRPQMAFCFTYKSANYLLKVENDTLMLQRSSGFEPAECHWFERRSVDGGNYYKLLSVTEPRRYLCAEGNRQRIFCLSLNQFTSVTHE